MTSIDPDIFWCATPSHIDAGEALEIAVHSVDKAGQTITVGVTKADGSRLPNVSITLDADGNGSSTITAPSDTAFVTLTATGHDDHVVNIEHND